MPSRLLVMSTPKKKDQTMIRIIDRQSPVRGLGQACLAVALLAGSIVAQTQFSPPAPPPYKLDNVQGEWMNYETQLIKPIHVSTNKLVVVANEPNGTLEFFDLDLN